MFRFDLNQDGQTTPDEIFLLAKACVFYPGDLVLTFVIGTDLGDFLNLSAADYGDYASGTISFFCYFMVYAIVAQAREDLKRGFDEIAKRKKPYE